MLNAESRRRIEENTGHAFRGSTSVLNGRSPMPAPAAVPVRRLRTARIPRRPGARPRHRGDAVCRLSDGRRGRTVGAPQRARQRRDLCRGRRRARPLRVHPHRRRHQDARRQAAHEPARRRHGIADRHDLSRRRAGSRSRPSSCATGSRARGRAARRGATPRPSCRNGPTSRAAPIPSMSSTAAKAPTTSLLFNVKVTVAGFAPGLGQGALQAARRAGGRRGDPLSRGRLDAQRWRQWLTDRALRRSTDPLRLRRPHRRAQCRQVDAGQPPRRRQGVDRHPQGSDDAGAHPRHRDRRPHPDGPRRHAGHLPPEAPARPRHGRRPPGAGRAMPTSCSSSSMPPAAWTRKSRRMLDKVKDVRQPKVLVLNKVDRIDRTKLLALAADANARADFAATFMISALDGLGLRRSRRVARRGAARGALVLSRGPDVRPADAPARRRDHPREALSAGFTRSCPIPPPSRPSGGRKGRTARSASSRSSMSSATARRRSCWAGRARRSRRSARPRARNSPKSSSGRSTSSCSSRCAPAGATIPSATAKWGLNSPTDGEIFGAMEWQDDGIILGTRRHGETSAIVELMTRAPRPSPGPGARRPVAPHAAAAPGRQPRRGRLARPA